MGYDFNALNNEILDRIMREQESMLRARARASMFDEPAYVTYKKAGHNDSPYYNENTIVGEVIEDDNQPEREPDGPAFNESLISERAREARRQRALYEYSAYSGLLGRPYEGSSISYNL